ncbi:MAG: UDP-N-acetylmuramoyl-L-alanine--D-glutamate ligase [Calditrichia bacterium]
MIHISHDRTKNRQQLPGARVAVLGAARSGISVALLLAQSGSAVLLSEVKDRSALSLPMEEIFRHSIQLETGGHSDALLDSDLICISPGLPLDLPILQKAREKGIPVVGELEVASWFCPAPIIAVTGSNGKTTTTALTGSILKQFTPTTIVAGNIGMPFSRYVQNLTSDGLAVLEVSSFQLETIYSFHPHIAVIMNLTANHLDRYADFEDYARAKLNILKNMENEDILIYNGDDPYLRKTISAVAPRAMVFSQNAHESEGAYREENSLIINYQNKRIAIAVAKTHLRGAHNYYNMMAAALIAVIRGVPEDIIQRQIEQFPGVEHRLEVVRKLNGVIFVNDSKATTIDSLAWALRSFKEPIILIAGGKYKGGDFSELNPLLKNKVRLAVLIGQAAERMAQSWQGVIPVQHAGSLGEAVNLAYAEAQSGDVVLLSPACSSFDMFSDYEDRGRKFKELVARLSA